MRPFVIVCSFAVCVVAAQAVETIGAPGTGRVQGGLCAILGVEDGALAVSLVDQRPFVVHALDADAARVAAAQKLLLSRKLYGKASVEHWTEASLPYADDLLSMLVAVEPGTVPESEMLRVLRPCGELYVRKGETWRRTIKPFPEGMDEWTHGYHGPDGNPVSKDRLIEVPRRVQWIAGRDVISERTFAVYAAGRLFAFERDSVVARDAFNGMLLWTKRAKTGFGDDLKKLGYHNLGMIAADGERVYFSTPDGKFKAHDAATEKLIRTYEDAGTPIQILCVKDGASEQGTLVLADQSSVRALDAASGKTLWKQDASLVKHVVADARAVWYVCGDFFKKEKVAIVSRELKTGRVLWEKNDFTDPCPWPERAVSCALGYDRLAYALKVPYRWEGGWRKYYEQHPGERDRERAKGGVIVISAMSGEVLLETSPGGASARHGEWNQACWVNEHLLKTGFAKGFGSAIYMYPIANLKGEPTVFDDNDVGDRGFGHCYPPTVTERFYIYGQLNFVDLETHKHAANQFTRGGCHIFRPGYVPANGMLYVTPKHCVCFPMLDGNSALAMAYRETPPDEMRLVKGPAWGMTLKSEDYSREWPAYRHDEYRTSGTTCEVPADVKPLWTMPLPGPDYQDPVVREWEQHQYAPGRITQPSVAAGKVFVAQPDSHRVFALDAATGKPAWEFVANGRVDTPPTVYGGMCLFGCRSGWLYNVRVDDGQLIWTLRVAPYDRRISLFGQVESPTPVPGSVAVIDGRVYAAGGLHPQADAGVRVVCVEPVTGGIIWKNTYTSLGYEDRKWGAGVLSADQDPWRRTGVREYEPFDLPVRDGDSVAVSRWLFDLKSGKATLNKQSPFYQVKDTRTYLRRRAWSYAPRRSDHKTPLAAALGASVFSSQSDTPRLFRVDFKKDATFDTRWLNGGDKGPRFSTALQLKLGPTWKVDGDPGSKGAAQAMVVAGQHLFVIDAGNVMTAYDTVSGKKEGELRVPPPVWDGLAAANGRLYLATTDGNVVCFGAP